MLSEEDPAGFPPLEPNLDRSSKRTGSDGNASDVKTIVLSIAVCFACAVPVRESI